MDGFLLIDKPIGLTSHDVVAKVRNILRQALSTQHIARSQDRLSAKSYGLRAGRLKVGHTGTLDPLASGLLILVLGSYTKRAEEFSKMDKTYEVELTLGATSATGDAEGPITPTKISYQNERSLKKVGEIKKVLQSFVGEIKQIPHAHSAVKVGGQRAYKLARQGKEVKLEPRQVTVYRLQVTDYNYPKVRFVTEVSSGTYIRSLAEDIGQKLGTGAYVSALRRIKIGDFDISGAVKLEDLSAKEVRKNLQK